MNERVAAIIRSYSSKFSETKASFSPEIPPNKIINGIKTYAPGISGNDVLFLLDSSLFGNGKEGVILNEDTLFLRNPFEKPKTIAIKDIQNITIKEAKSANTGMLLVQFEGPRFQTIMAINEQDAQLFAQMINDIKAALLSPDTSSPEIEVVVNETVRAPRKEFVRMVPIEAGSIRRYGFIHLTLQGKEYGTVENQRTTFFNHPKVILEMEMKNNKVYARTEGNNVFVNEKPLVGKRALTDQDRICLGKGTFRADYLFQADPKLAKELRHKNEQARGIIRETGGEQSDTYFHEQFAIDPEGIKFRKSQGGTKTHWKGLTEVTFTADYDFFYKKTNNLGNAAGQGLVIGAQNATSTIESLKLSDLKAFFSAPFYKVNFLFNGKVVGELNQLDQRGCAWIDEAIDRFAPMDLVRFI